MTHGASGTWLLVLRGRRINILLALRRSRRLLLCTDLRDKAVATKAKAKVEHLGVGETLGLPASQGRKRFFIVTSLNTLDGIARGGRDPRTMGHLSPSHRWDLHRRSMFLLTPVRARGTSISPRVLHKCLMLHRQATLARVWVEVEDRACRQGHQGPRGVSTQLYHRLTQRINQLYKVCFYYFAYG